MNYFHVRERWKGNRTFSSSEGGGVEQVWETLQVVTLRCAGRLVIVAPPLRHVYSTIGRVTNVENLKAPY